MLKKIFSLTAAALLLFACTDDEWPAQPDWSQIPNPDEEVDDGLLKPAACTNNIVAHRGGATECKAPDNSLASLRYAIGQGCYGSECDIYWTKDDNVVVAHADGKCQITRGSIRWLNCAREADSPTANSCPRWKISSAR